MRTIFSCVRYGVLIRQCVPTYDQHKISYNYDKFIHTHAIRITQIWENLIDNSTMAFTDLNGKAHSEDDLNKYIEAFRHKEVSEIKIVIFAFK